MVDVNLDPSKDTISLAAVTWMMNLFGPEMMYTPWNYHADFLTCFSNHGRKCHFFHLKDYSDLVDSRYVAQYAAITMMTLLTS